ncbi:hypothetical protein ACB094_07G048000 [Castanea mollissima]
MASTAVAVRTNITTDQSALLALKAHITDDPYKTLASNWSTSTSTSVCNWIGITCGSKHLRVTALNLSHMGLSGTIAPQVGKLTFLSHLSFRNNNFHGSLPNELASLRRLEVVSFGLNNFSGMLPSWLGFLSKLQVLYAYANSFNGSIPESLGNISSLKVLHLSENNLSGRIPKSLGNCTSLEIIHLDDNDFTGEIPQEIVTLPNLTEVTLANNSLTGHIPNATFNSSKIEVISLYMNQLSGNLPSSIGHWLPNLSLLYLWGEIPTIKGLCSLVNLSLAHNKFQGPIPQSFGNLISMERLDLSDNYFSGEIPKSLIGLKCLKYFNVSFNRLKGEIPSRGVFNQFSASSFMGNQALCGPPQLQVPPCKRSSKTTTAVIVRYILPAMIAAILALFLIFVLMRGQKRDAKRKGRGDLLPLATWRRITKLELEQATNGFSETNLVGKGSFGSVYKGTLSDGTTVAIKVFNLNIEGGFKSFEAECDVLCSIRHRNLVKIISSCSSNDFKALVLEYMPKGSLQKWLYSHNYFLDMLERLSMMIDVASSLEYLHHGCPLPIVHCDLKPSNILLNKDTVALVSDFGISKFLGNEDSMTQTMTLATIGYMAPEYGSQGIISTRGDVYSYGILLMETFTRKNPTDEMFAGEMNLKGWVRQSLPHSVTEVIDSNLLKRGEENFNAKLDCMLSIMQLAMACSTEALEERSSMRDVVRTLKNIKLKFLKDVEKIDN